MSARCSFSAQLMVCMASLAIRVMSRPEYAMDLALCMPSQHHAIGLHTDCLVFVPTPVVRLPEPHVYALWP